MSSSMHGQIEFRVPVNFIQVNKKHEINEMKSIRCEEEAIVSSFLHSVVEELTEATLVNSHGGENFGPVKLPAIRACFKITMTESFRMYYITNTVLFIYFAESFSIAEVISTR